MQINVIFRAARNAVLWGAFLGLAVGPAAVAQANRAGNFNEALEKAAEKKMFVVLDVSTTWCPFCKKMAGEVYPDKKFVEFSRKFVFLRVFADTDPEGERLKNRFRVDGYPTLIILNSKGREVDRIVGARTADELIEELELIFENAAEASEPLRL